MNQKKIMQSSSIQSNQLMPAEDQWIPLLTQRRHTSDFLWITCHDWKCSSFKYSKHRTPEAIAEEVYKSEIIQELLRQNPRIKKRIDTILVEMCHTFSLRYVRFVGYFLTKIMKSIYKNVFVDNQLVLSANSVYFQKNSTLSLSQTINGLAKECPILYVPSHRSYADFLIFSFACFSLDIPLPSIAAGIDFLALNQIASLLRCCGAFFIRRSFKHSSDGLYWHIFRAYLQSLIHGSEQPLEFFIEGTRSRSGKSLYPRTGLLSVALELFFRGQIPDIMIIPVSLSYERVLEEGLYAKELLPVDTSTGKPPETARNLLSGANAVLSQNFGSVYIRFCQPISVRELSQSHDIRLSHTLDSRCDPNAQQTQQELDFVMDLSKDIIRAQQMNFVFSPFSLAALVFLANIDDNMFTIHELIQDMENLSSLLNPRNLSFALDDDKTLVSELLDSFDVHSNIVKLAEDKTTVLLDTTNPLLKVYLQQYANQSMQLLIDYGIILYTSRDYYRFQRIKWFLSREFIYKTSEVNDSYILANFVIEQPLTDRIKRVLTFQIDFYINSYLSIAKWLIKQYYEQSSHETTGDVNNDTKSLVKKIQKDLRLTSDLIQNCLNIFIKSDALSKLIDNKLQVNETKLMVIIDELSQLSRLWPQQNNNNNQSNVDLFANNFGYKSNL